MKKITIIFLAVSLFLFVGCINNNSVNAATYQPTVKILKKYPKKIKLRWTKINDAQRYRIKVLQKNNNKYKFVKYVKSTRNSKMVKKLKINSVYYFRVQAFVDNEYKKISQRKKAKTIDSQTNLDQDSLNNNANVIFLHHSTGENIYYGGLENYVGDYNITEQIFPQDSPYGWNNYPYDYWNIWVNHAGEDEYMQEPTLEILTDDYDVIVLKHCFPVSYIEANSGQANINSDEKTLENYKLQYNALKEKMKEFPETRFIIWTGAALVKNETDKAHAQRAEDFFSWVINDWDETGDNIYIWDFWEIETDGGLYMNDDYAENEWDSHPNSGFSTRAAKLLGNRIINVIEGKGDNSTLTGE